jgi:pyruvate,orthophosphate dikinase
VGCGALDIDYDKKEMKVSDKILKEGDWISIDGNTGEVIQGKVNVKPSEVVQVIIEKTLDPEEAPVYKKFEKLMKWSDKYRKLGVRTNADTPKDSGVARKFGAEGIGLCRTEHMFFEGERIQAVREMILAENLENRKKALRKILPMQKEDFIGIFKAMAGFPVTIRFLDPPLHEFLPHEDEDIKELSNEMGVDFETLKTKVESLKEMNPMLGHRGCRLGISYPEITEMQTRAIIEAALEVKKEGIAVKPEIMIPLVGHYKEFELQKEIVDKTAKEVMEEKGEKIEYLVGTMIELPRAALTADEIAKKAEFFSFGTNDLTQTTFGLSRDDAGKFLPEYIEKGIYSVDPFVAIDQKGLGELMKIGVEKGRSTREDIKIGICGEHGGEPSSVKFCHRIGFNYVSCSPYRVPIARLSAAQAVIEEENK